MSITGKLFRAARLSADLKAITSGSPKKIVRRGKNKVVGRALGRAGVWRKLWR
jgi:hypothetical protein